ncbi:MAG: pentapeptide repeat-containing protein [Anaerolineaceae bacterium]|nr:pentapeptide repeat-containing protein [Anaerolineaceae bacterium]
MPFEQTEYEQETFTELICEEQTVEEISFIGCKFSKCDFHESKFKNCVFRDCRFIQCDLNLIQVDGTTFQNIFFEQSKMIGINWAKASWGKSSFHQLIKKINFLECIINYNTFMGIHLPKIKMEKCIAKEVNFNETDLSGSSLRFTDFEGSLFSHTNLTKTDLSKALNYNIDPVGNTLKKTRFSLPEALALLYNLDIELVADNPEEME